MIWMSQRILLTVAVDGIRGQLQTVGPQNEHDYARQEEHEGEQARSDQEDEAHQEDHQTRGVPVNVVCTQSGKDYGHYHGETGRAGILTDRSAFPPTVVTRYGLGQVVRTVLAEAVIRLHLFAAVWTVHSLQSATTF